MSLLHLSWKKKRTQTSENKKSSASPDEQCARIKQLKLRKMLLTEDYCKTIQRIITRRRDGTYSYSLPFCSSRTQFWRNREKKRGVNYDVNKWVEEESGRNVCLLFQKQTEKEKLQRTPRHTISTDTTLTSVSTLILSSFTLSFKFLPVISTAWQWTADTNSQILRNDAKALAPFSIRCLKVT